MNISVLFARRDSVYKSLALDVWDEDRDARLYDQQNPVIAHPPCRGWGRLRSFARVAPGELDLGFFAVDIVRRFGGVLEHPANSRLFMEAGLPSPGSSDDVGGWTLPVFQSWWGHRAPKPTWLYVVGVSPTLIPVMPFALGIPSGRIENMSTREREATPKDFAIWLCDLASQTLRPGLRPGGV